MKHKRQGNRIFIIPLVHYEVRLVIIISMHKYLYCTLNVFYLYFHQGGRCRERQEGGTGREMVRYWTD